MQVLIIAFIFFQVGLENPLVEAHCDPHHNKGCIYKENDKITSNSTTTETPSTLSISSITKSETIIIDPFEASTGDCYNCEDVTCICTYGEFGIRIPISHKNCKMLERSIQKRKQSH